MPNRSALTFGIISFILGIFAASQNVIQYFTGIHFPISIPYSFALPLILTGFALVAVGLVFDKGLVRENQEPNTFLINNAFWSMVILIFLVFVFWALVAYRIIK
jgi:hypothetical protein